MSERRIHARSILLQLELGLAYGVDPGELDAAELRHADAMVAEGPVYAHLERVAAATAFEAFAVSLAERHTLSSLGLVGLAIKCAPTGREAFARFSRYQQLMNELARHEIHALGERCEWIEHRFGPPSLGRELAAEVAAAVAVHVFRLAFEESFAPHEVELPRAAVDVEVYRKHFRAPVSVGAARARFTFSRSLLDRPLRQPDPEALAEIDFLLDARLRAKSARPAIIDQLRRVLSERLMSGALDIESAAEELRLSTRTLQRRLAEHETSFADVLDDLRQELAVEHLSNAERSVGEVAFLLGYHDGPAFHRAFRRWKQSTPAEWRRRPAQSASPSK